MHDIVTDRTGLREAVDFKGFASIGSVVWPAASSHVALEVQGFASPLLRLALRTLGKASSVSLARTRTSEGYDSGLSTTTLCDGYGICLMFSRCHRPLLGPLCLRVQHRRQVAEIVVDVPKRIHRSFPHPPQFISGWTFGSAAEIMRPILLRLA